MELWLCIIGLLWWHAPSLARCSLVCSVFRRATREYLRKYAETTGKVTLEAKSRKRLIYLGCLLQGRRGWHFLRFFPHLSTLLLSAPRHLTEDVRWQATTDVGTLRIPLHTLRLYDLPAPATVDLMKLITVSSTIEELDVQAVDAVEPIPDLIRVIGCGLTRAGPTLRQLTVVSACCLCSSI